MSNIGEPKDRFDLEQSIMNCWNVVEDIKTVYQMDDLRKMTNDEQSNALLGLMTLYQMKFEQMFSIFETMIANGNIK